MATNHNFRIKNGLEVGGTVIVSSDGVMTIPTTSVGATQDGGTNNTRLATTAFVQQEITTLIGGAPGSLDTLNELAAAINDDASYASTLTTALATKLPLSGGTLTGSVSSSSNFLTTGYVQAQYFNSIGGQEVILTGGESKAQLQGVTGGNPLQSEHVYAVAEGGLVVISSPNNWIDGTDSYNDVTWASRNTAYINNSSGNSSFPGTISSNAITITRASDGSLVELKRGTAVVGTIGVAASDNIYFAGESGSTKGIYINNAAVYPANTGGDVIDNAVDLGQSGTRWKNLYLSGTISSGAITATSIDGGASVEADSMFVNTPDGGGAPAMTALFKMYGYEGRGAGIKIRDSANSASSPSNREWFIGSGYNQSGFNIGYSSTGSQSSYAAQNKLSIDTSGNATFAGTISSGAITARADTDALFVKSVTNQNAAEIAFSSQGPSSYAQVGRISYQHGDTLAYGGTDVFTIGTTETAPRILADGLLMFKSGLALKPASGTGAGTTLITSGRALQNITTISSGAITSTGDFSLNKADGFAYLSNVGTGNAGIYVRGIGASGTLRSHSTTNFTWEVTGGQKMDLNSSGVLNSVGGYKANGTTVIDSSRNITAGAITATGATISGNYPTLHLQDTDAGINDWYISGGNGTINFVDNTNSSTKFKIGQSNTNHYHNVYISAATNPLLSVKDTTNNAEAVVLAQDNDAWFGSKSNHIMKLGTNYTAKAVIDTTGNFYPNSDSAYTLGTTSKRWSHIYGDALTIGGTISSGAITSTGSSQLQTLTIKGGTGTTTESILTFENYADTAYLKSKYTNPNSTTETYLAFHTNKSGESNGTVSESMRLSGNNLSVNGTVTATGGNSTNWNTAYTVANAALPKAGGEMTGALTIDVDNQAGGALRIEANQTNPDQGSYYAEEIYSTLSGSTVTTGDRHQGGLYLDINSTATGGDTSNEHRVYGVYADVDSTGDADLVYGIYANATATPTTGQTTNITGGYFYAEDNGGAGSISSVHGVQAIAFSDNATSDINAMYAGHFKAYNAADSGSIGASTAVYGELEIPSGTADIYGNSYVFRAEYDNNGTVAQTNTTYLYYGNYAGVLPTTAYGVYIQDDIPNVFIGSVRSGLGTTSVAGYGFNGDVNTGMYSPANHELGFTTNGTQRLKLDANGVDIQNGTLEVGGTTVIDSSRKFYFTGELHGNSKKIFSTGDTYLRMNQSSEFGSGIYIGSSNLLTSSGYIAAGSNGGTTNSRVYIKSGSYNGTNVIAIDGTAGTITTASNIQTTAGYLKLTSHNHIISSGGANNLKITTGATGASGILLENTGGNFISQIYGDATYYGFLDGAWANWDIKKTINGQLQIDEGSGLVKVWTAGNDGSGSGLDADTLDGQHGSYYTNASNLGNGTVPDARLSSNIHFVTTSASTAGNGNLSIGYDGSTYSYVQSHSSKPLRLNPVGNAVQIGSGNTVWHAGNDGSGSGLDADTLDGINSGSFLRSDADDTLTGNLQINSHVINMDLGNINDNAIDLTSVRASTWPLRVTTYSVGNDNSSGFWVGSNGYPDMRLRRENSTVRALISSWETSYVSNGFNINGNTAWHAGNDGSGSGLDADLLDGKDHTNFGATLATYGTTGSASGRIRCTAPFNTNSGHMFQVTVSVYSNYTCHSYVVSGYMYSTTNQWYLPKCVYTGTGAPDIKVGRDSNGKAYISIANSNYTGVRVHNMTRGYYTSVADTYDPWTITIDGATENSVTPTVSKVWHSTNDASGSGLDADLLDGQHGSYYNNAGNLNAGTIPEARLPTQSKYLRSDADDSFSGGLTSTSRDEGIFGIYDPAKTDHIWSMGTGYKNHASGTNFGSLYGLAYKHTNNTTGGTMGGGHQMVWCNNGTPRAAIGYDRFWHAASGTLWGSSNDGSGSGLDADTLDGQHGSYYYSSANPPPGDITGVTAGTGMTGGGTSGAVTLNVIGGTGITANADNIEVDSTVLRTANYGTTLTPVYAPVKKGTVTLTNSYQTVCTVNGNSLGSSVRMTIAGTGPSTVISTILDIVCNHYLDILVTSQTSSYTELTVKIISNNNEDFAIQIKTNSTNNLPVNMEVFALNSEAIAFTSTNPYSGASMEHVCKNGGFASSSSGGAAHEFYSNGTKLIAANDNQALHDTDALSISGSTITLRKGDGTTETVVAPNTTYTVGDGGLTQKNFTTTLKTKLDGIATSANNYSFPYTVSASTSTSTVVQRTGSGYIYANYFNTAPNDIASGSITKILAESGNDGFMRHATAAVTRTFLNVENGATADQSASEILTAIKTVDGAGSGLDADLLDGSSSATFLNDNNYLYRSDNRTISPNEYTSGRLRFGFTSWANNNTSPYADFLHMRSYTDSSGGNDNLLMFSKGSKNIRLWQQSFGSSTAYSSYVDIWHTGNDGSGSGLDADLLDGQQPSASGGASKIAQYATNGYLYVNNWIHPNNGTGLFYSAGVHFYEVSNNMYSSTGYTSANQGTLWGTSNDGSGSGLDADTLDGSHASSFITTSTTNASALYIRNTSPTVYLRDTDHNASMLHCNSNIFYILRGATDSTTWTQSGGKWPMELSLTSNSVTFGGNVTAYSDVSLKENIKPIGNSMEMFEQIDAKRFDWIVDGKKDIGFIAQDVQAAGLNEVVIEKENRDPGTGELLDTKLTLDYSRMVSVLWDVVKEQQAQIDELKKLIGV